MKHLKTTALLMAIATFAAALFAQSFPDSPGPVVAGSAMPAPNAGMMTMHIENNMDAVPIKGAPFCATITTEHTQPFADGNRIHTTDNSTLCRDSEGRTRREAGLNLLGAGSQNEARLITILDPVAGVRYTLDPDSKVAHKMALPSPGGPAPAAPGPPGPPEKGERMIFYQSSGAPGPHVFSSDVFFKSTGQNSSNEPPPASEDLGVQTFNGIRASGTRMTTTIPSGKMGNDKPILVTSERWYSADLKATVMTKHNDPWAGELKTEFTSVNTSEPDPSLFTVPSDYKIVEEKNGPVTIRMFAPAPPAQ